MATEITTPVGIHEPSLPEVYASVHVSLSASWWKRLMGYVGPGFLIAVGYMDPGNWATDIAGGARFGYTLLFVIMASNLMAVLLQSLSLKLGVATERDLAQVCRESTGPVASWILWVMAEVAIAACDMAEVIGSAIALNLLFHLPLFYGVLITSVDVLLILLLQRWGFRYVEAVVIALIGTILALFAIQMVLSRPEYAIALHDLVVPSSSIVLDRKMLFIAIGMLGATVMPHNLYLHSSIVQSRRYKRTPEGKREAIRMANIDSALALTVALFVNAAILIVAAAAFHRSGHFEVAAIEDAYRLLSPLVGAAGASTLFAVALLASGQNSSITGTLAGLPRGRSGLLGREPAERGDERRQDVAAVAGQRGDGDAAVDGAQQVAGALAGQRVLQGEQSEQGDRQPAREAQGQEHGHPEQRLRGGQQELLGLPAVQQQRRPAAAGQVRERQAADKQRPLVDLAGDQGADGIGALAVHREHDGHDELR